MSDKLLHKNAISKINGKFRNALASCEIADGVPTLESWLRPLWDAGEEVHKLRPEWLAPEDVFVFATQIVSDALVPLRSAGRKVDGPIIAIFQQEEIEHLAGAITDYVQSIPRDYKILFPLPAVAVSAPIDLSETVRLVPPSSVEKQSGLASLSRHFQGAQSYVVVTTKGYATSWIASSAFRNAISTLKRFIYLAFTFGVLTRAEPIQTMADLTGNRIEPIASGLAEDMANDSSHRILAYLPVDVSVLLRRIMLNDNEHAKLPLYRLQMQVKSEREIKERLARPTAALFWEPLSAEASGICSAMEWGFDALADSNETVSFIKTCIALEAALGEEEEDINDGITRRLADRCAFLLGPTPSARRAIRKEFKEIYVTRSRVVHGKVTRLAREQLSQLSSATYYLQLILEKEINALTTSAGLRLK